MKKIFLLVLLFIGLKNVVFPQNFQKPNNSYGTLGNRWSIDSVLYFPTYHGAPTDTSFLFSYGLNNHGQRLAKAALYYDSAGHHLYVWDPSLNAWHIADSSSGGTSGLALLKANNLSDILNITLARNNLGLSTVAASGAYADLSGTPSLNFLPLTFGSSQTIATGGSNLSFSGVGNLYFANSTADRSLNLTDSSLSLSNNARSTVYGGLIKSGSGIQINGGTGAFGLNILSDSAYWYDNTNTAFRGAVFYRNGNIRLLGLTNVGDSQVLSINSSGFLEMVNGGHGSGSCSGCLVNTNNLGDVSSASASRTNLGLGSVALLNSVSLTSNVSGILPLANGGNGTASPGVVAGYGTLITGSWPTQTIKVDTSVINSSGALFVKYTDTPAILAPYLKRVDTSTAAVVIPSGAGKRFMWIGASSAFRVGQVTGSAWNSGNIGSGSFATGIDNTASGNYSASFGNGNAATGAEATVFGLADTASGIGSTAMGNGNLASGNYSIASGQGNSATANYSSAFGGANIIASTAINATVFGLQNSIAGGSNFSAGQSNTITVNGSRAIAIGTGNYVKRSDQIVLGRYNDSTSTALFVVGGGLSTGSRSNVFTVDSLGNGVVKNHFTGITESTGDSSNFMATTAWIRRQGFITSGLGAGTLTLGSGLTGTSYNGTSNITAKVDTSLIATQYDNGLKVNISDTGTMLSRYLRKSDTSAMLSSYLRSALGVKYTDTASMLSPYVRAAIASSTYATITNLALKVNISDTSTMLSPYARKTFLSGRSPIGYSSSTGVISADTAILATQWDLTSTFDTVRIIPQGSAGIVTTRGRNDSIFSKNLVAGSNVTLTLQTDSSILIASSGSGGITTNTATIDTVLRLGGTSTRNMSVGQITSTATPFSAYTSKLKVVTQDTTTGILSHSNIQFIDTAGISTGKIVYWNGTSFAVETNSGGGAGNPNSNIGSGYRFAVPTTNNIKTLFCVGCSLDSTTNANALTLTTTTGTVTSLATGLGLSGGTITSTGTIILDTSYAMTKSSAQTVSGNKTFTGTTTATGIVNLTGILNDTANIVKVKVLVQDTANGKVYNQSMQTIDTTGKANGYAVLWNTSANHFITGQVGTVTSITAGSGLTGGTITGTGTIKADTSTSLTGLTTLYQSGLRVKYSDTSTMLSVYLRSALGVKYTDTASMLSVYLHKADTTAMLAPYLRSAIATSTYATISNLALKVNISDTGSMLSHYQRTLTLTTSGTSGAATLVGNTLNIPQYSVGSSGVTTVGTFSGSSQTNGASISTSTITFGPADQTNPGMVSTGTQTFAGAKTLTSTPTFSSLTTNGGIFYGNGSGVLQQKGNITFDATNNGLKLITPGIGITPSNAKGIYLQDTTSATSILQQESPALTFEGQGWKSNATAASQVVNLREYVLPTLGTASPSFQFNWDGSVNGGAYSNLMYLNSGGQLVIGNTLTTGSTINSGATVNAASGSYFTWGTGTTQPNLYSDANYLMTLRNGTHANELWVHNTYTSGSNYEAGVFGFIQNSNILSIGTTAATGTVRNIQFIGGNIGMGITPSVNAQLTLPAGTTTEAPLLLTSGTNLTTPVNGAVEYDGSHFYGTTGGTRRQLDQQASSGTFTPTLTNGGNATSISLNSAIYTRVGNIVHVNISLNLTAATNDFTTTVNFTLPITTTNGTQLFVGTTSCYQLTQFCTVGGVSIESTTGGVFSFFALNNSNPYNINIQFDYSL